MMYKFVGIIFMVIGALAIHYASNDIRELGGLVISMTGNIIFWCGHDWWVENK